MIEAGPCFVTAIRRAERDGYDAVQLAFGEIAREEAHRSRASATCRRPAWATSATSASSAATPGELEVGTELKVDAVFEKGQTVKVSGVSKGKGFAGHDQAPQLPPRARSHGSHNVRAPGSIGASADPARVFKGIRGPGQMGNERVTQRGLEVVDVRADENLLLVRGSVPGPKGARRRDQERRLMAAPRRRTSASGKGKLDARRGRVRRALPRPAGARGRARRARRAPARHRVHQDARRDRHDRRQGLAPEGHRPRARGRPLGLRTAPAAAWPSGPSRAATRSRSTARRAGARCAPRSRCTPSAARSPARRRRLRHPLHQGRRGRAREARRRRQRARGARRRRGDLRQVLPEHPGVSVLHADARGRGRPGRRRPRSWSPRPRSRASPRRRPAESERRAR